MPNTAPSDPNAQPKILLTRKQAAATLSVGERTLWTLTWPRGPIHSVRIGRSVRYSAEALRAWVASQADLHDREPPADYRRIDADLDVEREGRPCS